jgi:hypothetical protein
MSMCTTALTFNYDIVCRCAPQFTGKERDAETGLDSSPGSLPQLTSTFLCVSFWVLGQGVE